MDTQKNILSIAVQDSGQDISAEILERFFMSSSLGYQSKKSEPGIGMRIVKNVVEAHHGTISVASEMGKGSTFTIILPIDPTSHSASPPLI
jgi:two-component system sensor histidine kinase ResE